ncbi:hypothetical protein ACLOAV_006487 [Pseudogymnoascus australis]
MSHCRETSKIMEYVRNASEGLVISYYFLEPAAYYANGGPRGLEYRIAIKSVIRALCEQPWWLVAECGGGQISPQVI